MFAALASMAPAPVAVVVIASAVATFPPVIATFRLVIVLAAVAAVVILSAQREGADTENHQQAKYDQFLHKEVSPFRDLEFGFVTEGTIKGIPKLMSPLRGLIHSLLGDPRVAR
jgi:hypothetical protein